MLIFKHLSNYFMGFPYSSHVKESAYNAGDPGSILGLGRFHREGNGNPLQYSCLQNPMDRGIWWATDHGVTKSLTGLSMHALDNLKLILKRLTLKTSNQGALY